MSARNNLGIEQQRFADIYRREYPAVLGFAKRRTQPDRAEDIVHETFTTAWQRFDAVPTADDEVRPWLFGVARNHLLRDLRTSTRRAALEIRLAQHSNYIADGPADQVGNSMDLAAAWNQLPPQQQEIIALTGFEGLTSQQAGLVLGISATAFRLRLKKARAALRAALDHRNH